MKDDILIERKPGYKIYYGDGRYFVDIHQTVSHSYASIEGALEAVYNAEKRENKTITEEIAAKVREIEKKQGVVHLDMNDVLRMLDEMDSYRRENVGSNSADHAMRMAEAIVAKAVGFTNRNEWCELLKNNPKTKYAKDYADSTISFV